MICFQVAVGRLGLITEVELRIFQQDMLERRVTETSSAVMLSNLLDLQHRYKLAIQASNTTAVAEALAEYEGTQVDYRIHIASEPELDLLRCGIHCKWTTPIGRMFDLLYLLLQAHGPEGSIFQVIACLSVIRHSLQIFWFPLSDQSIWLNYSSFGTTPLQQQAPAEAVLSVASIGSSAPGQAPYRANVSAQQTTLAPGSGSLLSRVLFSCPCLLVCVQESYSLLDGMTPSVSLQITARGPPELCQRLLSCKSCTLGSDL